MVIAILSDIHGNYPALQALLADARKVGAQHFLVAGDLLDRSPYPCEVMQCLQSIGAHLVRGNSDQYLIDYARNPVANASKAVIAWAYERVGQAGADWLDTLPSDTVVTLPGYPPIRMVHASPGSLNRPLLPTTPDVLSVFSQAGLYQKLYLPSDLPAPLAVQLQGVDLRESLLVVGHTHIPWVEAVDGHMPNAGQPLTATQHSGSSLSTQAVGPQLVLNPGGGGLPVNGDPRAQYALVDWRHGEWQVEHRAVDYDREALRQAFYQRGLLPEGGSFARACLGNVLTGQNAAMFFILLYRQMEQTLGDAQAAWDEATRRFDWSQYDV